MINLYSYVQHLDPVEIKHPVPQVGSKRIFYESSDSVILTDIPGFVDFVVTLDGDLLLGKGHYKLNKKSAFLIMAGKLALVNGKIGYLDNDSGHYEPGIHQFHSFLDSIVVFPYMKNLVKRRDFIY